MNAPVSATLFGSVELAARDPILGVTEAFQADKNPRKVNLGVGVYGDDEGKLPLLECVRRAEAEIASMTTPHGYLPIDGIAAYDRAVPPLLFGSGSAIIAEGRAVTVQALGGTGALKLGADFIRRFAPGAGAWISDPSWENHRALFETAGFRVENYPYYDVATKGLDFAAMCATLGALPAGSVVVLHACCHNPSGVDLSAVQWDDVVATVRGRGLVPFLDLAYQGFGAGIEADGEAVRKFAATPGPVFVASSFSKSFSLYGERAGALTIVTANADESVRVLSQMKRVIRTNYSSPPTHGGRIVSMVLGNPELRALWERELTAMRERIRGMREKLVAGLAKRAPGHDFSHILRQRGMFSYSGLSRAQVERLRREHSIYAVETGRICVAALNPRNLDYVVEAIAAVL